MVFSERVPVKPKLAANGLTACGSQGYIHAIISVVHQITVPIQRSVGDLEMPIYEYACPTCGHKFEKLQSMSATGADCPHCEQPAKRAISVFAAVSKGDGFASDMSDLGGMPMQMPMGGGCGGACGCGH